jgi:hypothetical protein
MTVVTEEMNATLPAAESAKAESEIEAKLTSEIKSLWATHQTTTASAKRTKEELEDLRLDLGWKLSEMKSILVRTGRNGGWSAYLRSQDIPRASAERNVKRYEALANPMINRLNETISEPSQEDVRRLVRSLLRRLRKILTTAGSVSLFLDELAQQLETSVADISAGKSGTGQVEMVNSSGLGSQRCRRLHEPCENRAAAFVDQHPPTNHSAHNHSHSWTSRTQNMLCC